MTEARAELPTNPRMPSRLLVRTEKTCCFKPTRPVGHCNFTGPQILTAVGAIDLGYGRADGMAIRREGQNTCLPNLKVKISRLFPGQIPPSQVLKCAPPRYTSGSGGIPWGRNRRAWGGVFRDGQ